MKAKLTVNIDKELILRARVCAHSRGVSLSQLIESALRQVVVAERTSSFSERWRGKFRPARRRDDLSRRLAQKHL